MHPCESGILQHVHVDVQSKQILPHWKPTYVTGSEKTTLIAHFHKNLFCARTKAHIRSIVCRLFQAHSPFRCEVMVANADAVPLRLT